MKKIAKFEKVSYNQFKNDFMDSFPQYNEKEVEEIYHSIQLPKRETQNPRTNTFQQKDLRFTFHSNSLLIKHLL